MNRPPHWSLADLADLEAFLARDAGIDEDSLHSRDAAIARDLARSGNTIPSCQTDRRALLHAWLDARRATAPPAAGPRLRATLGALAFLAAISGLIAGAGATGALLLYTGDRPINVGLFLAGALGAQWVLFALALALRTLLGWLSPAPIHGPLLAALSWSLDRLASVRVDASSPADRRERARVGWAHLTRQRAIYGAVAGWPPFLFTQLFALCFNAGILAALLLRVTVTDLAFAWESTFAKGGPAGVHRVVSTIAAPWAWCAPDPHPTLDQIASSRFTRAEGIRPDRQEAMRAWWPFLCYAIAFYGVLPRAAILLAALLAARRARDRLRFDHAPCNRLLRRLRGASLVETQAPDAHLHVPPAGTGPHLHATGRCVALVARELDLPHDLLRAQILARFGWDLESVSRVSIDDREASAPAIDELRSGTARTLAGVAVVAPAWRNPIRAVGLLLHDLRDALDGAPAEPVLLLVGRVDIEGRLAHVEARALANWTDFNAIEGLHLDIRAWEP